MVCKCYLKKLLVMATFSKLLLPYGLGQPTPLFESGGCVRIYLLCTVVPIDGLVFRCNDACTRITLYCMPRFCYSIRFWQRQCISDPLLNRQHSADGHVSPNCRARNSSWLVLLFFLHTTSQGIFSNSTKDAASTVNQYRRCQQEIRSRFCGTCF